MGLFDFLRPKKSPEHAALKAGIDQLRQAAFPLGDSQVIAEADLLHQEMQGRLTADDCRMLLQRVKAMILLAESRDEARLADYVYRQVGGKLTREESRLTYLFIERMTVGQFIEGSGASRDDPVVIDAANTFAGIKAEYQWVQDHFGVPDQDWHLITRSHGSHGGGSFEVFHIRLKDGSERDIHFDISSFYGKFL